MLTNIVTLSDKTLHTLPEVSPDTLKWQDLSPVAYGKGNSDISRPECITVIDIQTDVIEKMTCNTPGYSPDGDYQGFFCFQSWHMAYRITNAISNTATHRQADRGGYFRNHRPEGRKTLRNN